jgi:DNA-directed RNA polymerase subunit beta
MRESMREGQTYSAPLYVTFHLKEETGTKEERVYMGEIPLMTPSGTFIVNGASAWWFRSCTFARHLF